MNGVGKVELNLKYIFNKISELFIVYKLEFVKLISNPLYNYIKNIY